MSPRGDREWRISICAKDKKCGVQRKQRNGIWRKSCLAADGCPLACHQGTSYSAGLTEEELNCQTKNFTQHSRSVPVFLAILNAWPGPKLCSSSEQMSQMDRHCWPAKQPEAIKTNSIVIWFISNSLWNKGSIALHSSAFAVCLGIQLSSSLLSTRLAWRVVRPIETYTCPVWGSERFTTITISAKTQTSKCFCWSILIQALHTRVQW